MKKLILSLTLAAFAFAPAALLAGDAPSCPAAKAAGDKKACCADQAKTCPTAQNASLSYQANSGQARAKKACCPNAAKAKAAKKAVSPKGAELAKN